MQAAAALHLPTEADEASQDVRWMNAAAFLLAMLVVGALLAAGMQRLARLPMFQFQRVQLEGELQRNNLPTVRAHIVPRLQGGFFGMDLAQAREVFEDVPWVRQATVRRVWPNELRVHLTEHQPAAFWQHEDRDDQLVNVQGEVFDANVGDVEETLPVLAAPPNPPAGLSHQMLDMLRALQPVLASLGDIEVLRISERGSWSVELDTDARLQLGRGNVEEVLARVRRFVRTLPELQRQYPARLAQADLRYPEAYAVKLRDTFTLTEPGGQPGVVRKPIAAATPSPATHPIR